MTDTPAKLSRQLLRSCDRATLATRMADDPDQPYASLVMAACGMDGAPLLFLSDLAEHSKNLKADGRASLMLDGTAGMRDPLAGQRITVQGKISACEDEALLERYCRRHPSAEMYRSFADFKLYRMAVSRVHIVAGFGYIHWVEGQDVLFDLTGFEELAKAEEGIVSHMNEDHLDAIGLICNVIGKQEGVGWLMTGIDPEGADFRRQGRCFRVGFDSAVQNATEARHELVRLTKLARQSG